LNASRESRNLDALRGTAVLCVLIAHLLIFSGHEGGGEWFRPRALGLLGVLFFFVHTSLVLMFSLERQERKQGGGGLWLPFMTRRVFRIYPLSIFVILIIVLLRIPSSHLGPGTLQVYSPLDVKTVVSNLLLAQNLTETGSILSPLWSLPYEIQMYVFLPALFLLVRKAPRVSWLFAGWALAAALSFFQQSVGRIPDLAIYVPCFVPGVMAYRLTADWKPRVPSWLWLPWLALLALIYMRVWDPAAPYSAANVQRGMFICLLVGLSIPLFREIQAPAVTVPAHLIAKYSYGIYLAHYICIWLAFMALGHLSPLLRWLVFWAAMVGLPVALFHGIESPLIGVGQKAAARIRPRRERTVPLPERVTS
jgi:peptidoglycan/LPS O-acetylase OafA/YrhL